MAKLTEKPSKGVDDMLTTTTTPFIVFPIQAKGHEYILVRSDGAKLAVLDTKTVSRLNSLKNVLSIQYEAVVESNVFRKRQRPKSQAPKIFPVSINIFGAKVTADDVGLTLERISANLQHPRTLRPYIEYYNPQFLTFDDELLDMREFVGVGHQTSETLECRVSKEIGNILDSLTSVSVADDLEELQPSHKLISTLKK